MTYREHLQATLKLSIPLIIGQLSQTIISLSDTTMVGNYNTDSLAAAALANGLFFMIFILGLGITLGITPLNTDSFVNNQIERSKKLLKNGVWLYGACGVLITIVLLSLSFFLDRMGQAPKIVLLARPYMHIISISCIPIFLFFAFRNFVQSFQDTRIPTVIELSTALLNVLLNYLLIFGEGGFPELGLIGAGWATLLARLVGLVAMVVYFMAKYKIYLEGVAWFSLDRVVIIELLKIGVPIGLALFFETSAFGFANIMTGWIDPETQAAHLIALNIASTTFLVALGVSLAGSVRVAHYLGLQQKSNVRLAGQAAITLAVSIMAIFALLIVMLRHHLPVYWVDDPQSVVIGITAELLVVAAIFQLSDGLQVAANNALRGMADVQVPSLITLFAYWAVGIPCGYLLGFTFGLGALGIWVSLAIALTASAALLTWRFYKLSKA